MLTFISLLAPVSFSTLSGLLTASLVRVHEPEKKERAVVTMKIKLLITGSLLVCLESVQYISTLREYLNSSLVCPMKKVREHWVSVIKIT